MVPVADAGDLYGLPLDAFVPERAGLSKALRADGRKDEAARVAALRKPSVAAWTVNQLVRTQRHAIAALLEAGDGLQRAQSELLAGRGNATTLREAGRRERDAVDELAQVARGLLGSTGQEPSRATLDRVSETLHAAALDEDARARVQEGCLERELRPVGFGGVGWRRLRVSSAGAELTGGGDAPAASPGRGRARWPEPEGAARAASARERAERLEAARKAETGAGRLAERAARDLGTAQERRDRAAASLHDAEEALAAARARAEEAALAHRHAQEALEGA